MVGITKTIDGVIVSRTTKTKDKEKQIILSRSLEQSSVLVVVDLLSPKMLCGCSPMMSFYTSGFTSPFILTGSTGFN